jgi:thymidylate kinase
MLITLYGINNIGKTTHAKRLVNRLNEKGYEAAYVKYPVYAIEPSGPYINTLLRSGTDQKVSEEELQLWFVLNRHQFQPTLHQWLSDGKIVVAEDYIGTGIAWGITKGLAQPWLEDLNRFLIPSDLSLLLDGTRGIKSIEKDHLHEENDVLIKQCRMIHQELGKQYGWKVIPLQPEKEETFELIWKVVQEKL